MEHTQLETVTVDMKVETETETEPPGPPGPPGPEGKAPPPGAGGIVGIHDDSLATGNRTAVGGIDVHATILASLTSNEG